MENKDKRRTRRINYICEIMCEGYNIGRVETRINDISVSGLFIDSLSHMPVGSEVKMRFTLSGTLIDVVGEVRYCMPQVGMGVQFLNLRPEHREVIERLVESKPLDTQPLVLPAQEEPPAGGKEPILMGSFATINLFDVVPMIESSRITGALTITARGGGGEVYFNEGQIVNARVGEAFGAVAVAKLLDLREGSFEFRRYEREYVRGISCTSNTGLLLDLLAEQDETVAYT